MIRVLCVGDVFGKPGRDAVKRLVPRLVDAHDIDVVIVNGENAAGGCGLTIDTSKHLLSQPNIGLLTTGNHIWRHREMVDYIGREPRILRPLNYPKGTPGAGYGICETAAGEPVGVINLLGRLFMEPVASPFEIVEPAIEALRKETAVILVDIHAEATSEKRALGWYLDGRVSVVFGTHTHVLTADDEILPQGTGFITDIGMTGPYDSVIGMRTDVVLRRFLTMRPTNFVPARGNVRLCGAIFDIDPASGKTTAIQRVNEPLSK